MALELRVAQSTIPDRIWRSSSERRMNSGAKQGSLIDSELGGLGAFRPGGEERPEAEAVRTRAAT